MEKTKFIKEIKFETIYDLFEYVKPWGENFYFKNYVYRGHSQENYELLPTILRKCQEEKIFIASGRAHIIENQEGIYDTEDMLVNAEINIIRSFYRLADRRGLKVPVADKIRDKIVNNSDTGLGSFFKYYGKSIWIPKDLYETTSLVQHYGLPTRFLDWSYDFYNALFFAFIGARGKTGNITIWVLNKEYLSIFHNIDKDFNLKFINPHYSDNPNLNAQKGLFTHWQSEIEYITHQNRQTVNRKPLDKLILEYIENNTKVYNYCNDNPHKIFIKFTIPCSESNKALKILERMGYDYSSIFPGYEGIAKHLKQGY